MTPESCQENLSCVSLCLCASVSACVNIQLTRWPELLSSTSGATHGSHGANTRTHGTVYHIFLCALLFSCPVFHALWHTHTTFVDCNSRTSHYFEEVGGFLFLNFSSSVIRVSVSYRDGFEEVKWSVEDQLGVCFVYKVCGCFHMVKHSLVIHTWFLSSHCHEWHLKPLCI